MALNEYNEYYYGPLTIEGTIERVIAEYAENEEPKDRACVYRAVKEAAKLLYQLFDLSHVEVYAILILSLHNLYLNYEALDSNEIYGLEVWNNIFNHLYNENLMIGSTHTALAE